MARKTKAREVALIQLLPNAMTLGAICAGVTAMRMAVVGTFDLAVALLILAAILDALDGRLARALRSESHLGAELDSLADVVNFGVAPAIVLYFFTLSQAPILGWAGALVYVVCCALRLARFNVVEKSGVATDDRWFTGVPSPAGALLALGPIFLTNAAPAFAPPAGAVALWLVMVGLLMVSRLPTFSLKIRIPRSWARLVLAGIALTVLSLTYFAWATLLAFDLVYLIGIALAYFVRARAKPMY